MSRHSNDLRTRVLAFLKSGNTKTKATQTFQISRQTLYNWLELEKTGKLLEIKQNSRGKKSRVNLAELKQFVDENPTKYYTEIGEKFGISKSQAHRLVKEKLGYASEKNKKVIAKKTKKKKPVLGRK